jgi:hypothetical protein
MPLNQKREIKMKIGLLRHFKTDYRFLERCDSEAYNNEYLNYEKSHIIPVGAKDFTGDYTICYAGTAPRALETAESVFAKEIIPTAELREVPLQAIFTTRIKLPLKLWHFINRIGWAFNAKKMPENRKQTENRARQFLGKIVEPNPSDKKILLVTHGFFMVSLQSELIKRGFKGKEFIRPEHGILYEFILPQQI